METHTAIWDWGDGTTRLGTIDGVDVAGSHTYTAAGVYTVTLTLTDSSGASALSGFQFVVVYRPSGGFVTGAG